MVGHNRTQPHNRTGSPYSGFGVRVHLDPKQANAEWFFSDFSRERRRAP
jgi:hypothetical protein